MRLLLHICCAPCSTATVEAWRADGAELAGVYFNPNIHPYAEHERRYQTLLECAGQIGFSLIGEPHYDIKEWLESVRGREDKGVRCHICIAARLRHTARMAAAKGFNAFSTTLLVSPYQEHEIIMEEGERAADEFGVAFSYRDLRPRYRRSIELSRAAGLYRQKYCGCIFSEEEAALAKKRHGKSK